MKAIALLLLPLSAFAQNVTIDCTYPDTRTDGTDLDRSEINRVAWFRTSEKLSGVPENLSGAFTQASNSCKVWVPDIQPGEYITAVVVDQQGRYSKYSEPYLHNPPDPAVIHDN